MAQVQKLFFLTLQLWVIFSLSCSAMMEGEEEGQNSQSQGQGSVLHRSRSFSDVTISEPYESQRSRSNTNPMIDLEPSKLSSYDKLLSILPRVDKYNDMIIIMSQFMGKDNIKLNQWWGHAYIVRTVLDLPPEERSEIFSMAKSFLFPDLATLDYRYTWEFCLLLKIISILSPENRSFFSYFTDESQQKQGLGILRRKTIPPKSLKDSTLKERLQLIYVFPEIPKTQWDSLVSASEKECSEKNITRTYFKARILWDLSKEHLSKTPFEALLKQYVTIEDMEETFPLMKKLLTAQEIAACSSGEKKSIEDNLQEMSLQKSLKVISCVRSLSFEGMNGREFSMLFYIISKLSEENRSFLFPQSSSSESSLKRFLSPREKTAPEANDLRNLIFLFRKISQDQWNNLVSCCKSLNYSKLLKDKIETLRILSQFPDTERRRISFRARPFIDLKMEPKDVGYALRAARRISADDRDFDNFFNEICAEITSKNTDPRTYSRLLHAASGIPPEKRPMFRLQLGCLSGVSNQSSPKEKFWRVIYLCWTPNKEYMAAVNLLRTVTYRMSAEEREESTEISAKLARENWDHFTNFVKWLEFESVRSFETLILLRSFFKTSSDQRGNFIKEFSEKVKEMRKSLEEDVNESMIDFVNTETT